LTFLLDFQIISGSFKTNWLINRPKKWISSQYVLKISAGTFFPDRVYEFENSCITKKNNSYERRTL